MKRIVILLISIMVITTICDAQTCKAPQKTSPKLIEQFVSDLSLSQRKKIEQLHKECRTEITALRIAQRKVRDSIATYNDLYGDHSKILYALYEREAKLQVELSKQFYAKKVALDKILTKKQHEEFIRNMKVIRNNKCD